MEDVDSKQCVSDFGRFAYKDDWKEKTKTISVYSSGYLHSILCSLYEINTAHPSECAVRMGV